MDKCGQDYISKILCLLDHPILPKIKFDELDHKALLKWRECLKHNLRGKDRIFPYASALFA